MDLSKILIPPALASEFSTAMQPMQGWCTLEKAAAMVALILATSPATIVEIGVFGGKSLIPQAMALRHLTNADWRNRCIYGIDPWRREANLEGKNDPANDAWWAGINIEEIHRGAVDAIWQHQLQAHAILIRSGAEHVMRLWPEDGEFGGNAVIDILHLDGNHSELASTRDVTNYLPRLRKGGYLWFDDTDWHTTAAALSLVAAECDHVTDVGTCRLFRKR